MSREIKIQKSFRENRTVYMYKCIHIMYVLDNVGFLLDLGTSLAAFLFQFSTKGTKDQNAFTLLTSQVVAQYVHFITSVVVQLRYQSSGK